jgi:hypothetical protein
MQHGLYKYLNNPNPPADDAQHAEWDDKRIKVAGILYQCMGEQNHQQFINKQNAETPKLSGHPSSDTTNPAWSKISLSCIRSF